MLRCCLRRAHSAVFRCARPLTTSIAVTRKLDIPIDPDTLEPSIPAYEEKPGETVEIKRARLLWQSRKRGMLENGLLLSTFADKYLGGMTEDQLRHYDRLINLPSNDWDIYYWAVGVKEVPAEFDNDIMRLFRAHVLNKGKESRLVQPELR